MKEKLIDAYHRADNIYQTMSDEARSNFLIRALFDANKRCTKEKVFSIYKDALGIKRIDEVRLTRLLNTLIRDGKVLFEDNLYYLPSKTVKILSDRKKESDNRIDYIIDNFFSNDIFTERSIVVDWLLDSIVTFFSSFSNAWISDLTNKENAVESKKEDVIRQIENRTYNNRNIDKRDKQKLASKFFTCIISKDHEIVNFLWEYGTLAFALGLVKKTAGTDELSLSLFENSVCILDTNILIDVALEGNDRHEALDVLSEIFSELNVKVYTLSITREEYRHKIKSKFSEISRLLFGNFQKVLKDANDQFVKTAAFRGCEEPEDFERMFQGLETIPTSISNNVTISDFPEDEYLKEAIKEFVDSEKEQAEFKSIYLSLHHREKKDYPLRHDLGLLGASNFLSRSQKVFVLSDDSTMNVFAKRRPYEEIPIALRLDTLINVLAIKKGGMVSRESSFKEMFANIIQKGFIPYSANYNTNDLLYILEKDKQVVCLEPTRIEQMARDINRMRIQERSEADVARYIINEIQTERQKDKDDLKEITYKYHQERNSNIEMSKKVVHTDKILNASIHSQAKTRYNWHLFGWFLSIPITCALVYLLIQFLLGLIPSIDNLNENYKNLSINIIASLIIEASLLFNWNAPKLYLTHK